MTAEHGSRQIIRSVQRGLPPGYGPTITVALHWRPRPWQADSTAAASVRWPWRAFRRAGLRTGIEKDPGGRLFTPGSLNRYGNEDGLGTRKFPSLSRFL